MSDLSLTEQNDKQLFYNYLNNKINFNHLKVKKKFYIEALGIRNSFLSDKNKLYFQNNPILDKKETESKNKINIPTIPKIKVESYKNIRKFNPIKIDIDDSPKVNLKLNNIKMQSFISSKKVNQFRTINSEKKQKNKKIIKPTKTQQKYFKILHGLLDKDLYKDKDDKDNKDNLNEKNNKHITQRKINNFNKKSKSLENNNFIILDSINYGKSTINNCILRNKIIYDIKPLNKSEQKGKCFFPSYREDINNKYAFTDRNIINFNPSNLIPTFSNQSIINKENENEKNNINKSINKNIIKEYKNKKIKKKIEIPLYSLLGKDMKYPLKESTKMKTFYGRGSGDLIRGETIKFIKTTYPVKFIKPLLTHKGYILKLNKIKINSSNNKIKKKNLYDINSNVFKRRNQNKIKHAKAELEIIKGNIFKEFNWFDEQKAKLFDCQTEDE